MQYKVIEYIEFTQNTQILKIAVFAINPSEITKYSPKNDHSIAIFSTFFYKCGILRMVCGESSCPDALEYVWQRRVGGFKG